MVKLCRLLEISRSGYYAWLTRGQSRRTQRNQALLRELVRLHEKYPVLGLDSLYHMVKPVCPCSRGRVHRLMKAAGASTPCARKPAGPPQTPATAIPSRPICCSVNFPLSGSIRPGWATLPTSPLPRAGCIWPSSRTYVPKSGRLCLFQPH